MAHDSCLFVVTSAKNEPTELEQRLAALREFYAPLGLVDVKVLAHGPGWIVGRAGRRPVADGSRLLTWGEPLGAPIGGPSGLLAASPTELRSISGMTAAVAWERERVRLVNSPGGPATFYEAQSVNGSVFSTTQRRPQFSLVRGLA